MHLQLRRRHGASQQTREAGRQSQRSAQADWGCAPFICLFCSLNLFPSSARVECSGDELRWLSQKLPASKRKTATPDPAGETGRRAREDCRARRPRQQHGPRWNRITVQILSWPGECKVLYLHCRSKAGAVTVISTEVALTDRQSKCGDARKRKHSKRRRSARLVISKAVTRRRCLSHFNTARPVRERRN